MDAIVTKVKAIENPYIQPAHPVLLVISGPSGVGKDSVVRAVIEKNPAFHFVVTATSRPARPGEINGVDYIFVSEAEFKRMIADDELLEHAIVHDNYKGVPKQQIREALDSNRDVIMRVDPQGAATLKKKIPNATFIFLAAESEEVIMRRLRARRTESDEAFNLRMTIARNELKRIHEFDYLVVNQEGKIDRTVEQILAITEAEKCRVHRKPIQL